MTNVLESFLSAARAWICDEYFLDVRYIADVHQAKALVWEASVSLNPLPPRVDFSFHTRTTEFIVGQTAVARLKKEQLMAQIESAALGMIELDELALNLPTDDRLDYYSELVHRERWFCDLHLQVLGARRSPPTPIQIAHFDNELRVSKPPFDGLSDLSRWLGLSAPGSSTSPAAIAIRVGPPVDLILDECSVSDDLVELTLHAHPHFETDRVRLAVVASPGTDLSSRQQIGHLVQWNSHVTDRRVGKVRAKIEKADTALAVLMIENSPVRRQWFVDKRRARNRRLAAIQHFDQSLRMLRLSILESPDPSKFEQGVATLAFLHGFSPGISPESDAPDLVVMTPGGALVLVECTTRTSDIATKLGKLVDRRGSLVKHLREQLASESVVAALVCRQPRDQIAVHRDTLRTQRVILIDGDTLAMAIERSRAPSDPDELLQQAISDLDSS